MDTCHLAHTGLLGTNPAITACPSGSCTPAPHGWLSCRVVTREGDGTCSWGHHQAQLRAGSQRAALPAAGAALGLHPDRQRHGTVLPEPIPPVFTWEGANALIPFQDLGPHCYSVIQVGRVSMGCHPPQRPPLGSAKLQSPSSRLIPHGNDSALF